MVEEKKRKIKVETTTLNVVPLEEKKTWIDVTLIQAGVYICAPSLLLGSILVSSMSLTNAIIAGVLGYVISAILMSIVGMMGSDIGRPTVVLAKSGFGNTGTRWIVSTVFIIANFGWFAVQNVVCGNAFSNLMSEAFGLNIPIKLSIFIWGIIMLLTAVQGIDGLKILNNISVPALFIVFFVGCYLAIDAYGIEAAFIESQEYTMSLMDGIIMTASFLSVGMTIAPDFTRYQKDRKGVAMSSCIGMIPAGVALLIMGAILTKITGEYDLSVILTSVGIPVLGITILILATWTTNTTNAYASGLALVMMFNLKEDKRAIATLISGVIGTVAAMMGVGESLEGFVNLLGLFFFPIAGVMIADYWIIRKGDPLRWGYVEGINWSGILAWILGIIATLYLPAGLFVGFIISVVGYVLLRKVLPYGTEVSDM